MNSAPAWLRAAKVIASSVSDLVGGEVGLALLGEGRGALLGLVGDREDIQAGLGQLGQAALVVGVGIEGMLEEAERRRAVLGELADPGLLVSGVLLQQEPDLAGTLSPAAGPSTSSRTSSYVDFSMTR